MTDHHDWPDPHHDDDPGFHDQSFEADEPVADEIDHADHFALEHDFSDTHQPLDVHETSAPLETSASLETELTPDIAHPPEADATLEPDIDPEPAFPPALDVGELPEPIDGHPWIDTGSLGVVDPATMPVAATDPVDPGELAAYAGTELPPGADPWATLADSDDPATAALARWWGENPG